VIDRLKPYAVMKESGVPWLGKVPEHWEVRRLKSVCTRSALYGANVPAIDYTVSGVRFLRTTDITDEGRLKGLGVFLPEDTIREYVLNDGDLLLSRSGTIGRSFLYDRKQHGSCAYAGYLVRFVPGADVVPAYLFLFTKTQAFAGFLRVMAISSTIENVNGEKYANCSLPLPSLPEQAAIIRILDHAGRRIRRYIRAKQKLIKLLEEQKQAIIHRAVTRGLDPDVRLKPSGIPWIGDVPHHWELTPNRAHLRIRKRLVGERHPEYRLLSLTKRGVIVRDLSENKGKFSSDMGTSQEVMAGDFVFCLFDVPETPRTVALSSHPGMITGAYTVMECANTQIATFLEAFYIAMDDRKLLSPLYSGLRNTIPKERLLGAKTPLPPPHERDAILAYIREVSSALDEAVHRTAHEIDLLREYRSRLIADVVTGKLDVREAAARLPDEVEEPEPLEELEAEADTDEAATEHTDAAPEEVEA